YFVSCALWLSLGAIEPVVSLRGTPSSARTRTCDSASRSFFGRRDAATGVNAAALSRAPSTAISPSLVATTSPGRKVGSLVAATGFARPKALRPLQVQPDTSSLR